MKKKINALLIIGAIAFAGFGFVASHKAGTPAIGLNIGNKAPELNFKNPEGKPYSLAKINKGKIRLPGAIYCRVSLKPRRMNNLPIGSKALQRGFFRS